MTATRKRALAIIGVFLLSTFASFAVQGVPPEGGGKISLQYVPGIVMGAASALILYYGGILRESLTKSAPVYGLVGSAVTILWALLGGQDMHGFRFDILGFRALFAQSDFFFSSYEEGYPFTPYAGYLTMFIIGGMLALAVVSLVRAVREKSIAHCLKPGAAAVICLLLPFVSASTEYWIHTLRCWANSRIFSFKQGEYAAIWIVILSLYLLFGFLPGVFCVKKHAHASRIISALIFVLSISLWYIVAFGFMFFANSPWFLAVNTYSLFTSGVFFGFSAGVSIRILCARKRV